MSSGLHVPALAIVSNGAMRNFPIANKLFLKKNNPPI